MGFAPLVACFWSGGGFGSGGLAAFARVSGGRLDGLDGGRSLAGFFFEEISVTFVGIGQTYRIDVIAVIWAEYSAKAKPTSADLRIFGTPCTQVLWFLPNMGKHFAFVGKG
jgi:hypothetical protein